MSYGRQNAITDVEKKRKTSREEGTMELKPRSWN